MTWILMAVLSAAFAGLTSILAKCGIKKTDSDLATAIRTVVVLIFSWIMVFIVGAQSTIGQIDRNTLIFLIL
jgi:transporter family protein